MNKYDFKVEIVEEGAVDISNLPENYFVNWLEEKQREGHLKFDFKIYEKGYLSKFITENDIRSWNPETPVFISSQTGTGKNYFIQDVLVRDLILNNLKNSRQDKILILSKRIALNRQSKLQIINLLRGFTGEEFNVGYYTPEGIDKCLKKLGNIYVYSYKQFFQADDLSADFKYVVCDECHYFTSDALIEPKTNEILNKIINGLRRLPIRIYMSATMDVVFESILRMEYQIVESKIAVLNKENDELDSPRNQSPTKDDFINIINNSVYVSNNFGVPFELARENQWRQYWGNKEIRALLGREYYNKEIAKCHLNVCFYYFERDYSYVSNFYYYSDDDVMLEKIISDVKKDDNSKWIVFVPTKSSGKNLLEKIRCKISDCVFINSESRQNNVKARAEFDCIIDSDSFKSRVLLATSTLDNGINIKDKNVKNVVIDFFDETEFLQMLGRIRVENGDKINLFVRKYDVEDLKKILRQTARDLLGILISDTKKNINRYVDENREKINLNFYYLSEKSGNYEYNINAVYNLVDKACCCMRAIKKIEPDYHLDFSDDSRSLQAQVYKFYRLNGEGYSKVWSRVIVDLFESDEGLNRQDKQQRLFGGKYIFDLNFRKYIFDVMIPKYYQELLKKVLKPCLSQEKYDEFVNLIENIEKSRKMSMLEQTRILVDFVSDKNSVRYIQTLAKEFDEKINYYAALSKENGVTDTTRLMMYWLGKINYEPEEVKIISSGFDSRKDWYESYLKPRIVEKMDMENHRHQKQDGTFSDKYYDEKFLKKFGVLKDNPEINNMEERYSVKINKGSKFFIDDSLEIEVHSYSDGTEKHKTYYIFHSVDDSAISE